MCTRFHVNCSFTCVGIARVPGVTTARKSKCHPGSVWAEKTTARINNFHPSRCGSKVPRASTSGHFTSTPSAKPPRGGPPKATGSSHVCAREHHQATDAFGLIHVGVGLCVAELPLEEPEEKEQVGAFCLAIEVGSDMPLFWWHGAVLRASHPRAVWCTGMSTRGLEQTTALRHTHRRRVPECVRMPSCEMQLRICRHSSSAWSHDRWRNECQPGPVRAEVTTARVNNFHPGSVWVQGASGKYFRTRASASQVPPRLSRPEVA